MQNRDDRRLKALRWYWLAIAIALMASTFAVTTPGPADAYCYNGSHMTIGFSGGFGYEGHQYYGTCDNDTFYAGHNKDDTQDGYCIITQYQNAPGSPYYINCANNQWINFSFNDTNSSSRFKNCKQTPGLDPCTSWVNSSSY